MAKTLEATLRVISNMRPSGAVLVLSKPYYREVQKFARAEGIEVPSWVICQQKIPVS